MVALTINRVVRQIATRPTRLQVLVLTTIIWAGIYLPGLGSVELKHEEPRRALPALHMLASGDWLVPRVGSIPFLRKPPMLHWLIALSFLATGTKSEWAVRLPSALATLALALAIGGMGSYWLGPNGGFFAAILFLTNFAILETGRLAELEAVYIASSGIGLLTWIVAWLRGAQGWGLWLLPALFLSLAMLTKGPTHLLFFYGVVIPTLFFAKDLRALGHPAHWCALGLIVGLFGAWAIPCSLAAGEHDPIGVWRFWFYQITSRAGGSETGHFHLVAWLLSFPNTLKNFLPWTPLLIFLWPGERAGRPTEPLKPIDHLTGAGGDTSSTRAADHKQVPPIDGARKGAWFRGARLGMVVTCVLMTLLPNGSPRYLYPLFVVPCLLLAQVLIRPVEARLGLRTRLRRGQSNSVWKDPTLVGAIPLVTAAGASASVRERTLKVWRVANLFLLVLAGAAILSAPFFARMNLAAWIGLCACALLCFFGWVASRADTDDPDFSDNTLRLAVTTATVFMIAMLVYSIAIVPRVNSLSYGAREVANSVRAKLPPDAILWVHENEYRPFWYYLEPQTRYFLRAEQIPPGARYVILPKQLSLSFRQDSRWKNTRFQTLSEIVDNEKKEFVLLEKL
jgi:4-amino-4-deoxy-L-arabinose transferase-like glycosyltransferase